MAAEELSLLRAFGRCYEYFIDNFIFSDDVFLRRTIVTLLTYLSAHQGVGQQAGRVGISVVKYCLHNAEDEDDLGAMFEFLRDVELAQPEIANVATAQCLASKETDVKNLLRNIGKVCKRTCLHYNIPIVVIMLLACYSSYCRVHNIFFQSLAPS